MMHGWNEADVVFKKREVVAGAQITVIESEFEMLSPLTHISRV